MAEIRITRLKTRRDRRRFLTFPWQIYDQDPLWVPPLLPERKAQINPAQGVFFQRGEAEFFLAFRDGRLAGTICLAEDPPTNQARNRRECIFGFLEYIEDYEVFRALIDHASKWAAARGLDALYGPWNLDYENGYGVLVEGRGAPPALMCGHTPSYYRDYMEDFGFLPARAQNLALRMSLEDSPQFERLMRLAERMRSRGNVTIREADFGRWREEIDRVHSLLTRALAHLGDHIGWQREALEATLEPFKSIADPSFILFADVGGETVGFLPGLANLNEILIDVNGLRYPWDALKLLWLAKRRVITSMTVKSILVLPEYWNTGVTILLAETLLRRAREKGYQWVDLSITSADNPTSVRTAEKLGAEIYKRWQVYQLPLGKDRQ